MFANIYSHLSNAYNYINSGIRNNQFIYNLIPVWFQMIAPVLYSNMLQLEGIKPYFNSIYSQITEKNKNDYLNNKNNTIVNFVQQKNMGGTNTKKEEIIVEKKKAIPKKIRDEVWGKYHGNSNEGVCYCCGRMVYRNNAGWQASHVIAEKSPDGNPGEITVENLRVGCAGCNISCGNGNLYVYIRDKDLHGPGRKNVDSYFKKNPSQANNKRTNNWGNNKKKLSDDKNNKNINNKKKSAKKKGDDKKGWLSEWI